MRCYKQIFIPDNVKSAYEIVIKSMNLNCVEKAIKACIDAALRVEGVIEITAANFKGKLEPHKIYLRELIGQRQP